MRAFDEKARLGGLLACLAGDVVRFWDAGAVVDDARQQLCSADYRLGAFSHARGRAAERGHLVQQIADLRADGCVIQVSIVDLRLFVDGLHGFCWVLAARSSP
jgi:hypothetical protein